MARQIEVSIHASNGDDIRQSSLEMDVPDGTSREQAEVLASAVAKMMGAIWKDYRVTVTVALVDTERKVVSYGDVRFHR